MVASLVIAPQGLPGAVPILEKGSVRRPDRAARGPSRVSRVDVPRASPPR